MTVTQASNFHFVRKSAIHSTTDLTADNRVTATIRNVTLSQDVVSADPDIGAQNAKRHVVKEPGARTVQAIVAVWEDSAVTP